MPRYYNYRNPVAARITAAGQVIPGIIPNGPNSVMDSIAATDAAFDAGRGAGRSTFVNPALAIKDRSDLWREQHDNARLEMERQKALDEGHKSYADIAKTMYETRQNVLKNADVGNFYSMLSHIDRDDPHAGDKIAQLKAEFPLAMESEGVRSTLSNDWSDVLAQRGLTRADRQAAQDRDLILKYSDRASKDDTFEANNPALKQLHDMAANRLLKYEQDQQAKQQGGTPAPTAAPITAASLIPQRPQAAPSLTPQLITPDQTSTPTLAPDIHPALYPTYEPGGSASDQQKLVATPPPPPPAPPIYEPAGSAADQLKLATPAVPPASTPKNQQIDSWAATGGQ